MSWDVPFAVGQLHQLVDHIKQIVVMLPQQPLIERLVTETHLLQHSHHGGILAGWVNSRPLKDNQTKVSMLQVTQMQKIQTGVHNAWCNYHDSVSKTQDQLFARFLEI